MLNIEVLSIAKNPENVAFGSISCTQNRPLSGSLNSDSGRASGEWRVASGEWRVASEYGQRPGSDAGLRRSVRVMALRRADVFDFEPGPTSWKHAPTPERGTRQEPLGPNRPLAFTLCHRASGPSALPSRLEPVAPRERDGND